MTLEEREQLQKLLHELIQVRVTRKDPVAEDLILEACKRQPDALYILVQRLMMAEQALERLSTQHPGNPTTAHPATSSASPQFLNPGLIASTALGVVAGSALQRGWEAWSASGDLPELPDLGDVDL